MKKNSICFLILVLILLTSCKEEITHSRTIFPDIKVQSFIFTDEGHYYFYFKNHFGGTIYDFDENIVYSHDYISFQGFALSERSILPDPNMREDITNYLYDKYPGAIEKTSVNFVDQQMSGIKIFSDKDYNTIKAGEPLNRFFKITTRLVVFDRKKNSFKVADGNIAEQKSFADSFVPFDMLIEFKAAPDKIDKYTFFMELTSDKGTYQTKIATISLR